MKQSFIKKMKILSVCMATGLLLCGVLTACDSSAELKRRNEERIERLHADGGEVYSISGYTSRKGLVLTLSGIGYVDTELNLLFDDQYDIIEKHYKERELFPTFYSYLVEYSCLEAHSGANTICRTVKPYGEYASAYDYICDKKADLSSLVEIENEEDLNLEADERLGEACRLPETLQEIALTSFQADAFLRNGIYDSEGEFHELENVTELIGMKIKSIFRADGGKAYEAEVTVTGIYGNESYDRLKNAGIVTEQGAEEFLEDTDFVILNTAYVARGYFKENLARYKDGDYVRIKDLGWNEIGSVLLKSKGSAKEDKKFLSELETKSGLDRRHVIVSLY